MFKRLFAHKRIEKLVCIGFAAFVLLCLLFSRSLRYLGTPRVEAARVELASLEKEMRLTGRFVWQDPVELGLETVEGLENYGAQVLRVLVEEGQAVEEGQLLAELQPDQKLTQALERAKASLDQARLSLLEKEGLAEAYEVYLAYLEAMDAEAQVPGGQAGQAVEQARARLMEQVEAGVSLSQLESLDRERRNLESLQAKWLELSGLAERISKLCAPADGYVAGCSLQEGDALAQGETALVLSSSPTPLVRAALTGEQAAALTTAQSVTRCELRLGTAISTVRQWSVVDSAQGVSLLLESGLDKRGLQGEGCELSLFYTTGPQVCVPLSALQQWTGSAATVYTIQRTNGFFGDQDQAAGFAVSVLDHDHQRAVIRSPLGQELLAGTLIVGRAQGELRDGGEILCVNSLDP